MKRGIAADVIAPKDRRGRPLAPEVMVTVGEPTQRGASTRLLLTVERATEMRDALTKALRRVKG